MSEFPFIVPPRSLPTPPPLHDKNQNPFILNYLRLSEPSRPPSSLEKGVLMEVRSVRGERGVGGCGWIVRESWN